MPVRQIAAAPVQVGAAAQGVVVSVRGIAMQATAGLARHKMLATGAPIAVPVGDAVLDRLLGVAGTPRHLRAALPTDTPRRSIHKPSPKLKDDAATVAVSQTGIKVIDLPAPVAQGGKVALFGGAGVGKALPVAKLMHAVVAKCQGISVFTGVGERSREGHELLTELQASGVLARTALVYGQMNEPPGACWRVPLPALTGTWRRASQWSAALRPIDFRSATTVPVQ